MTGMRIPYDAESVWIWMSRLGRPVREIIALLMQEYGTAENIWRAAEERSAPTSLQAHPTILSRFADDALRQYAVRCRETAHRLGMRICTPDMLEYPPLLREIYAYPCALYYYGRLPAEVNPNMRLLSAVGSRSCTAYGLETAALFGTALAQAGVGLVSGMARGIDGAIHKAALRGGGYTAAVLGCGADVVYPKEHRELYRQICQTGCVLSELPPGSIPDRRNFPARNRMIAGMTEGTLVVEARRSSGAMITVDRALEFNRTVYAVPGNIHAPASQGCNGLIQSGACCVTCPEDILEDMGLSIAPSEPENAGRTPGWLGGLPEDQGAVARAVSEGARDLSQIAQATGRPFGAVAGALTMLEIRGILGRNADGSVYLQV